VGGGKDGGGGGSADNLLTSTVADIYQTGKPNFVELNRQLNEALTTGGVNARIPLITAAQAQSRDATARALLGTEQQLARTGLARTPYGASTLAQTRLAGEQATQMIPSQVASQIIGMGPQVALGPLAPAVSGMGQAAGIQAQQNIAKAGQQTQLLSGLAGAGASIGSAYLAAGAGSGAAKGVTDAAIAAGAAAAV